MTPKRKPPPPQRDYGIKLPPRRRVWWCSVCGEVAAVGAGKVDWRDQRCGCGRIVERRTM